VRLVAHTVSIEIVVFHAARRHQADIEDLEVD
jgi:hypothetical protein